MGVIDLAERIAALETEVADLRVFQAWAEPLVARLERKARPPSDRDRAILAEIRVALAELLEVDGEVEFATGDLSDDPEVAKARGEALARLLPHSPVDGILIERFGPRGHRTWRITCIGAPGVL